MRGRFAVLMVVLLALILAGCTGAEAAEATPIAFLPTATLPATPTLVNGASAGSVPTPPVTPRAGAGEEAAAEPLSATASETAVTTPTVTPPPQERLAIGDTALGEANFEVAIEQFQASLQVGNLTETEKQTALYNLGVAYLQDEKFAEAAEAFKQRIAAGGKLPEPLYFQLGQALAGTGDAAGAIAAYETYLAANTDTGAYVGPIIAQAYLNLGDRAAAVAAYETAVTAPAHRLTEVANRLRLAEFYLEDANYPAAIAQYDAVQAVAQTEVTKGRMAYLAGYAELLAGNTQAAYERYQTAVNQYPGASESYQALVALVNNNIPVDEFQRGLVDFNVSAYQPGIDAFLRYIEANPENYRQDTHLYLAWSYEGLGNLEAALAELEQYAAVDPAKATIERAKMLARFGDAAGAQAAYQRYIANYPNGEDAPFAAWWAAVIADRAGNTPGAIAGYTTLADIAPFDEDAPEALFRAGWLAYGQGDVETAVSRWERSAQSYPGSEYGNASLVWLLRTLPEIIAAAETADVTETIVLTDTLTTETPQPAATAVTAAGLRQLLAGLETEAAARTLETYYAVRARDMAQGTPPFAAPENVAIPENDAAAQREAEAWLKTKFGLETEDPLHLLSPALTYDARRMVGEKLWQIGLYESAKLELESLRQDVSGDPLASYQLALFFRDLGLYRSSIIAAQSVLTNAGVSVFQAPEFIGRLLYPAYYADLILPLAERYGFDPLLQFALVRQESLFESFARSGAAAQGLSQVIPDTGAYIAERLNWPNYENADLYKPFVGLNFGAYYLDQQIDGFDGSIHAALAAYNAGPGNAARWFAIAGDDLDLFKETMDFAETRKYIDRIYLGQAVYRHLYGAE
ncbi:MAG: transglycosylase SLT domain-containing protein [Chloroflexota bacterium]